MRSFGWMGAITILLVVSGWTRQADATGKRLAIVVGNNVGTRAAHPLRFAESDAGKLSAVLTELGGWSRSDVQLLQGRTVAELRSAIDAATQQAARWRRQRAHVTLFFFFSGHSDGESLELGPDRVPFRELKRWLRDTSADLRILLVDACKSGALLREKGGRAGAGLAFEATDPFAATGEVILSSSASHEQALESENLKSSFYSHHFVSGLRGAADRSGDGLVTLIEAHEYAARVTATSTADIVSGPQHPGYRMDLAGFGDVVLTDIRTPAGGIVFAADLDRVVVENLDDGRAVAEIRPTSARRLALHPRMYRVVAWMGAQVAEVEVAVQQDRYRTFGAGDIRSARAAARTRGREPIGDQLPRLLAFIEERTLHVVRRIERDGAPAAKHPRSTDGQGLYLLGDKYHWSSGFFAGVLWGLHDLSGAPVWRRSAEAQLANLQSEARRAQDADLAFKMLPSFLEGLRRTESSAYRATLLAAAGTLAARYNLGGACPGVIASWDPVRMGGRLLEYPVLINGLMHLELLFWGARQPGGDPRWHQFALEHALRTASDHVRPDGSTYHVVDYASTCPGSGYTFRGNVVGISDASTWTRGQAWGLYGFTMAYRYTRHPTLLAAAMRVADHFLQPRRDNAHLIPVWDLTAPPTSLEPRDTSAAAIAASALLELGTLAPRAADRARYHKAAETSLSLLASRYLARNAREGFLGQGVGTRFHSDDGATLIFGDHYFLEAIRRYRHLREHGALFRRCVTRETRAVPTSTFPLMGQVAQDCQSQAEPAARPGEHAAASPR